MRILIDECVPWPIRSVLGPHQCATVQKSGWQGIRNGDLLQKAEGAFDLFLTADQNLRYQQNLAGHQIRVLELSTNNLRRLEASAALIRATIDELKPGEVRRLEIP